MKYIKLGRSGLDVSRLCLGCMSFGVPERGAHPWTLDEEQGRPFIRRALELGFNFFDTAKRDEVVVATKVFHSSRKGPNSMGLSRKAILSEVDASLRRLGMDYIDL